MKSKINSLVASSGLLALAVPFATFAQTRTGAGSFTYSNSIFATIITFLQNLFGAIFPVITAGLILYFAYTVFQFMRTEGGGEGKSAMKSTMMKALLALFIWFTFYGIIQVVANSLGLGLGDTIQSGNISTVDFNTTRR